MTAPDALLDGDRIKLSVLRRQIGAHMVRSVAASPHVSMGVDVDLSGVELARAAHGEAWRAREGFSLTYLPFIGVAVCRALREYPDLNATIDGRDLVRYRHVNLGIAVDLEHAGLVVPVVHLAEVLTVTELARAANERATAARDGRLTREAVQCGTYTLSNPGGYGTLFTTPIINQPQVAVLSTDGVRRRPVVADVDGVAHVVVRPVGVLVQSFDHRAVDGAYSAAFLARLRQVIETTSWLDELSIDRVTPAGTDRPSP